MNEIQEDFEIDSVGQVENSEETLQKMKSAIIGILDDEIFALNKKNKKWSEKKEEMKFVV